MDHSAGDLPIFESGAIMWYLATQYDPEGKLFPKASTIQKVHLASILPMPEPWSLPSKAYLIYIEYGKRHPIICNLLSSVAGREEAGRGDVLADVPDGGPWTHAGPGEYLSSSGMRSTFGLAQDMMHQCEGCWKNPFMLIACHSILHIV